MRVDSEGFGPVRFPAQEYKFVEINPPTRFQSPSAVESRHRIHERGPCRTARIAFVKDERQRVTILYSGQVQGVGFRYAAREVAEGFDVCGTVRNLPDGRVELVAEGSMHELDTFRQAIRDSGVGPLIRDEVVSRSSPQGGLRGFQIVR